MELERLSKEELIKLINNIKNILEISNDSKKLELNIRSNRRNQKSDLESLIGSIPFILLNTNLLEKNQDVVDFAKRLDIIIPSPEKKNREDIIGRVISAISNFDTEKIRELNNITNNLLKISKGKKIHNSKELKSSFFNEWDAAIKQMKI